MLSSEERKESDRMIYLWGNHMGSLSALKFLHIMSIMNMSLQHVLLQMFLLLYM